MRNTRKLIFWALLIAMLAALSVSLAFAEDVSAAAGTASIAIHHIDAVTRDALQQAEVSTVEPGAYGPYQPYGNGYFDFYYGGNEYWAEYNAGIWDESSAPVEGTIEAGQHIDIIFKYDVYTGMGAEIQHKDKETGELLWTDTYYARPETTVYHNPYEQGQIPGHPNYQAGGWDSSSDSSIAWYGNADVHYTIVFLYDKLTDDPKPITGTVTIEHRDADTGELLMESFTEEVEPGEYGPYNSDVFPGYFQSGRLADDSALPYGTIDAGDTVAITYLYEKNWEGKAIVWVTHREAGTNQWLDAERYEIEPGAYGPFEAKDIEGYGPGVWDENTNLMAGAAEADEVLSVTFLYEKLPLEAYVTVRHVLKENMETVLREDAYVLHFGPDEDYVMCGFYGPEEFEGYGPGELWSESNPDPDYIAPGETKVITYVYEEAEPLEAYITVRHVLKDNMETVLHEDAYVLHFGPDESFLMYGFYGPEEFAGYGPGKLWSGSNPDPGGITPGTTKVITYVYEENVPEEAYVTVRHVQKDQMETVLREDAYVLHFEPGESYLMYGFYGPEEFAGYGPGVLWSGSNPDPGGITPGATKVITYLYEKRLKSTVYVVHKDFDTGKILRADTHIVDAGDYGPYNATVFTGYGAGTRASNSAPASGTVTGGQTITITYLYNYTLGKATVYVVHKNRDTGAVLKRDTVIAEGGHYGPYGATTFAGYAPGYLASNSAPASGLISGGQTLTITYLYTGKAVIYVVHKDRGTGAVLRADTNNIPAGEYGPYSETAFDDYGPGYLASNSAPVSGTASPGQSLTITYLYNKTAPVLPYDVASNVVSGEGETPEFEFSEPTSDGEESGEESESEGEELTSDGDESGGESEFEGEEFTLDDDESEEESESEGEEFTLDGDESELEGEELTSDGDESGGESEFEGEEFTLDGEESELEGEETCKTTATIIVIHKDLETEEILWQDEYTVTAGSYGPYDPYELSGYDPGLLSEDSAPASGDIGTGEVKIILYLYSRSVDGAPAKGAYNVEFVSKDAEFVFEDAGVVFEDAGSSETEFVFE